jgi:hypothetical protein
MLMSGPVRAVPCFAWDIRETGKMLVWIRGEPLAI